MERFQYTLGNLSIGLQSQYLYKLLREEPQASKVEQ